MLTGRTFALFGVVLLCTSTLAAPAIQVGIPAAQFNSVASSQDREEWCWAASIQMVLNWHGVAVKQKDIVQRIYGRTVNAAATEEAVSEALSGTAYTRSRRQVTIYSRHRQGPPDAEVLLRAMRRRHPMLITVRTGERRLHAVVITAAEYAPGPRGPIVTSLLVRDPKPTRRHPGGAVVRISGRKLIRFLPNIGGYWLVEVH